MDPAKRNENELTVEMDVKMDLKEKKLEYFQLRAWTRCVVKIEAIKLFPCFIKITLTQNNQDYPTTIVIKINIPGVAVQLASSRSKAHSYGLFWTQHRKNCCIFFALDSAHNFEQHYQWIQNAIQNLELHRREILETRRASRISKIEPPVRSASLDSNVPINETQDNIKDINDILGPLPNVPDSYVNWSRRVSGISEIYEEIDDADLTNRINRMISRTSIASGIYEVMTSPFTMNNESHPDPDPPPPLPPPRHRVNTQTEINRAYTNPESISLKKRKKNIFESVFLRNKTSQKPKLTKNQKSESPILPVIDLLRNHRMSFSSPDLSKTGENHYENEFENDLMARSSATEFSFHNEHSFLNSTASSENDKERLNISENILPTFNFSCNESTVNLVGSNLNGTSLPQQKVATLIDDPSGYCTMAPIIRNKPSSAPPVPDMNFLLNDTRHSITKELTKSITFRRDYGVEQSVEHFENLKLSNDSCVNRNNTSTKAVICENAEKLGHTSNQQSIDIYEVPLEISKESKENILNSSFKDKYPSYYPNDTQKIHSKELRNENISRKENVYISTPRRSTHPVGLKSHRSNGQSKSSINLTPTIRLSEASTMPSNPSTPSTPSHISSQHFLTVNSSKDVDKSKKNDITNSLKRFASLPRFKKIDFSPLKLRINNVLQRQNPDQM